MKISIAIPQYNRIDFLLKNLERLSKQTYPDIEIVVADDASTDHTEASIRALVGNYRFPLIYFRHPHNVGYDANLRKSLELCTGEYCFILGNDDTLYVDDDIAYLVDCLEKFNRPAVGFCNFCEESTETVINRRAAQTALLGHGPDLALRYHKSFSFVAGIIFKKDAFLKVNTDQYDGSIYVQIYMATRIIAEGGNLFTVERPMVLKDIKINDQRANSYRDSLFKHWSELKPLDGGLPSMVSVANKAFIDAKLEAPYYTYQIVKKIYTQTYPFWLLDYRRNGSFIGAIGLFLGLKPKVFPTQKLDLFSTSLLHVFYWGFTLIGLFTPIFLFQTLESKIYQYLKK